MNDVIAQHARKKHCHPLVTNTATYQASRQMPATFVFLLVNQFHISKLCCNVGITCISKVSCDISSLSYMLIYFHSVSVNRSALLSTFPWLMDFLLHKKETLIANEQFMVHLLCIYWPSGVSKIFSPSVNVFRHLRRK